MVAIDCYCDYDPPAFYRSEIRKARKVYRCDECPGSIIPGELYEYVSAKWDDLSIYRTCERCVDLRTWVKNNVPCFCWGHQGLNEYMDEAIEDAIERAPKETIGLKFGYLRRRILRTRFNKERKANA